MKGPNLGIAGLGFGKKSKQVEEKPDGVLTEKEFEHLCYDALKRVEKNREDEMKKEKEIFNKIAIKDLEKNPPREQKGVISKKVYNPLNKNANTKNVIEKLD